MQKNAPSELTLYFYPSPGLDWKTPSGLTRSTMVNSLLGRKRSLGHVTVRIQCEGVDIFTGMTQMDKKEGRAEVLWKGFGLGILLHNFVGRLETKEELEPELLSRTESGRLSFLKIKLKPEVCQRLAAFLKAYQDKKGHETYGMVPRPLYGEGGGCSAFGAAFLETAGILEDEFRQRWTRNFLVPKKYIGGPSTKNYVSPLQLFFAKTWAKESEEHTKGFFWDPDLMHEWAMEQIKKESEKPSGRFVLEQFGQSTGLVLDRTDAKAPTTDLILSDTTHK